MGTFSEGMHGRPGTLEGVRRRLPYLRELGIGAIQLMPPFEFAGDRSWGYNPAYPFAVESAYGDPDDSRPSCALREFGIAVLLDVVYNRLGPSDLDLWRFDGWSENDKGGIYFYQDDRLVTHGVTHDPDYGRYECRSSFLRDNAMTWLDEFRIDGLRWDATACIEARIRWGRVGRRGPHRRGLREFMAAVNAEAAYRFLGRS